MNREIKFRAWIRQGKMQYNVLPFRWDFCLDAMISTCTKSTGNGFLGSGGDKASFDIPGFRYFNEEFDSLMQYTGLKDRNGKEIYEGDVVNIGATDFDFIVNGEGQPVSYEVKHNECDFVLYRNDLKLQWGRLSRLSELNWHCEVIGNIYETHELINP